MTLHPSDMICFALYAATHAMQQAYRPVLDDLGITYPQYLVMSVLWSAADPQTVSGIGKQVQLESSTLTPLLKRLATAGLIRRTRDSADERRVLIALTDAGHAMQARAAHIPACIADMTGLDMDALTALQTEVAALSARMRTVARV